MSLRTPAAQKLLAVLVIDPSADAAEALISDLRGGGYAVEWERVDAPAGLAAALARRGWDLVFSEYTLPGFSVAAALRQAREHDPHLPFIVVADAAEEEVVAALRSGANDYLTKGRLARLLPAVERELREAAARRALRESERRYRAVIEKSFDAATLTAADGTIVYAGPGTEAVLGRGPGEQVGRNAFGWVHPDDLDRVRAEFAALLAAPGGFAESVHRGLHADGSYRWLEARGTNLLEDPAVRAVVVNFRDVTDRRGWENELRAQHELLRAVAEGTSDAVYVKDRDGRYLFINPAGAAFFGKPVADVVGRTDADLFDPQTAARVAGEDRKVMAGGGPVTYQAEAAAAGASRVYLTTKAPYRGRDGGVEGVVGVSRDVTDRVRAAETLAAGEARYRELFEANPHPMWVYDTETLHFLAVNDAAVERYGFSRAEFLGMTIADIRPPEDVPALLDEVARPAPRMQHGTVWRHRWKDGTVREVEVSSHDLQYAGRPARLVLVLDVTDRRRAEAETRAAKAAADRGLARLRAVVSTIAEGVVIAEPEGAVLEWNPAALRIHGFASAAEAGASLAEVAGRLAVTAPDGRQLPPAEWPMARVLRGEVVADVEVAVRRLDTGREITVRCNGAPVPGPGGGVGLAVLTVRDVTAERWAEAALRASEERYRTLFDRIPVPLFVYDRETFRYLAVNDAAVATYGYTRAEFLGMTVADVRPPGGGPPLPGAPAGDGPGFEPRGVWRHRKKDGTVIDVEVASHGFELAGRPACLALAVDVTARTRLEEQFRQAQKMEAVGRLAGGVAHDFNNLLTAVNGFSELALEHLSVHHPARDFVADVRKAGERAAGLTRQLLAFSRRQILQPRVLDLNAVVTDLGRMLDRVIGEDVELATDLAPGIWPVLADPGQVEQVLLNLAVNARDAMPTGGRFTLRTRAVGEFSVLEAADTGVGMTEEVKARAFEPFFTTKEVGKGTGLGLATVHGIVAQSGGRIEVESRVGAGTTFRVFLPRAEAPPAPGGSHPGTAAPAAGVETVLVAEDDPAVRSLAVRALRQSGYTVLEAGRAEELVGVIARHPGPIHLLVTDVVLPGMGGRELAALLGVDRPGLRVLYISGYTDDAVLRHGIAREQVHFLQKPFTPAALAAKVREVLDAREDAPPP